MLALYLGTAACGVVLVVVSMLLGGGCFIDGQALSSVYLQLSGEVDPQEHQYRCYWQNPDLGMIDEVVAWATCLMPAE